MNLRRQVGSWMFVGCVEAVKATRRAATITVEGVSSQGRRGSRMGLCLAKRERARVLVKSRIWIVGDCRSQRAS